MQDHRIEGVGDVDAEDLLAMLDAENVHDVGADEVGFSCLYNAGHYNGDSNPSAHINRESLLWRCKGCGRAGNLLELVKIGLPHGTTHPAAMSWLREHFGEVVRKPKGGSLAADLEERLRRVAHREPVEPRLPNEAATIGRDGIFYMDWTSDHPAAVYMRDERGFWPDTLEHWGFGYDSGTNRIAIPYRDADGVLVGFKGRALDDRKTKYLLLGDTEGRELWHGVGYGFDMHDHREYVFGLDRAKHNNGGYLTLVEGELNVVACHAAGITNAVAPGTTSITKQQLWLLRAHADSLVLFYDSDDAGENAVWGYADEGKWRPGLVEKISPYFRLYVCDDHEGDAAGMTPEEIRHLVTGAHHWLGLAFPSESAV
jgi:DNA primase